jgi:Bacteriophage head to tail connecting protein.
MAEEYTQESVSSVTTAKGRFDSLRVEREPFLARAREVSKLTIPSLIPPEGSTGATKLPTPFQSVGSKGLNNLASKLLLALFPPGSSFFKLSIDDFVLDQLIAQAGGGEKGQDAKGQFEKALAKVEHAVVNRMESVGMRVDLFGALKHLLAGGNCLTQMVARGKLLVHPCRATCVSATAKASRSKSSWSSASLR